MPHQIRRQKLVIQIDHASQLTFVVDGLGQLRVLPTVRCSRPTCSSPHPSFRGEQADFGMLEVPPSSVVRDRRAQPPQSSRTIALVRQARSAVHLVPSTT